MAISRLPYITLPPAASLLQIVTAINNIMQGKLNVGGEFRTPTVDGMLTVKDDRVSPQSIIAFVSPRLGASFAVPLTGRVKGSFNVTWQGAAVNDDVTYVVIG